MSEIEKLTVESVRQVRPDLYEAFLTAGKQAEQKRFAELQKTCGDNLGLLVESFVSGRESEVVMRTRIHELERENRALRSNERFLLEQYEGSPALQKEFHSPGAFIAYTQHEAKQQQREADKAFEWEQRKH